MSALSPDPQPPDARPDPNPPPTPTPPDTDRGRARGGSFATSDPTASARGAQVGLDGASAAKSVSKSDDRMPADPEPEAEKRVFAEWLGQLTRTLSESERVDPGEAFDALVDLEDCTPDPIPEDVLVAAAVRLLRVRETDNDPDPASILRQIRAELAK
jgi:hypothetical protein